MDTLQLICIIAAIVTMNATLTGWIIRLFRVRHYNQIEELRRENTILQEKLQQVQDEKRQKEEDQVFLYRIPYNS